MKAGIMNNFTTLRGGLDIPLVGLGLWRVDDEMAARIIRDGVEAGYRLLDTATMYGNETGVGKGIRECGVAREELLITTKVWNDRHGHAETRDSFFESLKRMGLDYLDIYLIHWPVAGSEKYLESWDALIALREEGLVKAIGVSNFLEHHIVRLVEKTQYVPEINQIECHPYFRNGDLIAANSRLGVKTECWAPLGRGKPLRDATIIELAEKHGKTPAQTALRWNVQQGRIVIPKTENRQRMRENIDIFDFSLSDKDLEAVNSIAATARIGDDPDTFVDKSFA